MIRDWYLLTVYLMHIIAITPIMIYIGLRKNKTNPMTYRYLKILGVVGLVYHGLALLISLVTGSWTWGWNIIFPF